MARSLYLTKMIAEIFILLLAIPAGFLIAWLAHDELASGKRYFMVLCGLSLIGVVVFAFMGEGYLSWMWGFVFVVGGISLRNGMRKI